MAAAGRAALLSLALLVGALAASAQVNVPPTDVSKITSSTAMRGLARDPYPSGVSRLAWMVGKLQPWAVTPACQTQCDHSNLEQMSKNAV
jgi:hypothetical protein